MPSNGQSCPRNFSLNRHWSDQFYLVAYGSLNKKDAVFRVTAKNTGEEVDQGVKVVESKFKKYKKTAFKLSFEDGVWLENGQLSLEIAHFAESDGSFINWYYCYKEKTGEQLESFRKVEEVTSSTAVTTSTDSTTTSTTTQSSTELTITTSSTTTEKPTTTSTTTTTTTTTTTLPVPVYGTPDTADIVFVVEGSEKVGEENFRKTMSFIQQLSEKLVISPGKDRIALITYSDSVVANFYFIDKRRKLNIDSNPVKKEEEEPTEKNTVKNRFEFLE